MKTISPITDFFKDGKHMFSMSRLLCFLAFFPASYIVITNPNSPNLGLYLGAYAASYVAGKVADNMGK